jgi:phage-related protein
LREAFGDNDEDFTRLIGSQEGLNAILALTGENSEAYTGIVAEMTDGIGVLDEAMAITADTAQFKFDQGINTAKDSLIEIGGELLDRLLPYLDDFKVFMDENGPFIEEMFDKIFEVVEILAGKLGELGEAIMPTVIDLFTDENFMSALERIGEAFLDIVDEVISFINSDIGQFLLDLTSTAIIVGINTLATAFEFLNDVLAEFNRLLSGPVRQTDILKGLSFGEVTTEMRRGGIEGGTGYLDFATGGVVMPRPGGVLGRLAEVGQPEVVIPLAQLDSMLSEGARSNGGDRKAIYNINVNAGMGANGAQIGEQIVTAIKRYERTSGPVFARA